LLVLPSFFHSFILFIHFVSFRFISFRFVSLHSFGDLLKTLCILVCLKDTRSKAKNFLSVPFLRSKQAHFFSRFFSSAFSYFCGAFFSQQEKQTKQFCTALKQ